MIKVTLSNEILRYITTIEKNLAMSGTVRLPVVLSNKLRKNSKKKSSYASNRIEGNPLSEEQAEQAIDSDPHRHFLRPEQEIRNYYLALELLEEKRQQKAAFSEDLILEVQALVEKGASKEKIGLRKAMPPGVLFAVYDAASGVPEYIPPEYIDIPDLLKELVDYVNTTDDHPLIVAGVVHYQLVTIHPFEDGNGRTARLLSGYVLDYCGYGFGGIGSLEEYFAYDVDEYYRSIQMGLPPLYYDGRDNPPEPEIWMHYFLRMVELYSTRVCEIVTESAKQDIKASLTHLKPKEKELLAYLVKNHYEEFTPIEVSRKLGVNNKTVINRCVNLAQNGFVVPQIVKSRIRSYRLSELATEHRREILRTK